MIGLQRVENRDADYLAQRFGVRPIYRMEAGEMIAIDRDGRIGVARSGRRLSMGYGSNSSFFYVYGHGVRPRDRADPGVPTDRDGLLSPLAGGVDAPSGLACQVVLRAPCDGILTEYTACVCRLLTLTLKWLEWDPPVIMPVTANLGTHDPRTSTAKPCPVVAGGGASEMFLSSLFRELKERSEDFVDGEDVGSDTDVDGVPGQASARVKGVLPLVLSPLSESTSWTPSKAEDMDTAITAAFRSCTVAHNEISMAFDVLATALGVIPLALIENACVATHQREHDRGDGYLGITGSFSHHRVRNTLKRFQAVRGQSSASSVMKKDEPGASAEGNSTKTDAGYHLRDPAKAQPKLSLSCALNVNAVHPLSVKYGALVALLDVITTALRVSGVVTCHGRFDRQSEKGGDESRDPSQDKN